MVAACLWLYRCVNLLLLGSVEHWTVPRTGKRFNDADGKRRRVKDATSRLGSMGAVVSATPPLAGVTCQRGVSVVRMGCAPGAPGRRRPSGVPSGRVPRGPLPGRTRRHLCGDVCRGQHPESPGIPDSHLAWVSRPGSGRCTSRFVVAVCLSLPRAIYMAVRGHGRGHNLEMTGTAIGIGAALGPDVVGRHFDHWPANLAGRPRAGLWSGLPVHDRRMLINFSMYSGRRHRSGRAA